MHVCAFCFFKNGYPGKERASKDTQLQVTKLVLELNICVSFLLGLISKYDLASQISLVLFFFCFVFYSDPNTVSHVHLVSEGQLVITSSAVGHVFVQG